MERKKSQVIAALFEYCNKNNNFEFDNNLVKDISKKVGFGNPFDVTKLDNIKKLPEILIKNDYAIIHLGNGKHKFIKGINNVYHSFEPIQKNIDWKYNKSLLNLYNSSESNALSVANNQRILHHFFLGKDRELNDIEDINRPKTYFPHRTKTSISYNFGKGVPVILENIQIEIDLTIEYKGTIGVFEAKTGIPDSFNIYQLYHPFLYYHKARLNPDIRNKIRSIFCIYLVRTKAEEYDVLKLWEYTFKDPLDITSMSFIKSAAYTLIEKKV